MNKGLGKAVTALLLAAMLSGCGSNSSNMTEEAGNMTAESDSVMNETGSAVNETGSAADETGSVTASAENGTAAAEPQALKDIYADYFKVGVALNSRTIGGGYADTVIRNFNSMTCENETKPENILDMAASAEGVKNDPAYVAVHFDACAGQIAFCEKNGIALRLHTLVWHSQTPQWFFYEDYNTSGKLASAEVMEARMQNYINAVIQYFDTEHPGLVYAIDVVNEAFNGNGTCGIKDTDNLWYDTIGYDYLYYAFLYTRQAVEASSSMQNVSLVYNDYGMIGKVGKVDTGLEQIFREHDADVHDYVDAIGFQAHLDTDTVMKRFAEAVKSFADEGYGIQITELDIGIPNVAAGKDPTEDQLMLQGEKYRSLMERLMALHEEGCNITSVSVWGISDDNSWRNGQNGYDADPLLWGKNMTEKPALRGMALCDDIESFYQKGLDD